MRRLNTHLRGLPDGTQVSNIELRYWEGVQCHQGAIVVYGPFAVYRTLRSESRWWDITHTPSGYWVDTTRTKREAVALIARLRTCGADWTFTSGTSLRAQRAKQAAAPLIARLRRVG